MKPLVGAKTDVGRVRQGNEDSYLVHEPLFAVADGMGGHLGGEVASETAVETIKRLWAEEQPHDTGGLAEIVRGANTAVWEKAQNDANLHGMGTTCTLVLLEGHELHLAHVGDSRAYLYRNEELSQVTEDHTLVGRMVREGRLQPEEAERHPQRSIITRALGVDADVEVDELSLGVEEGDRVLLCSDGLTSMISFEKLAEVLRSEPQPDGAVERLVQAANDAGGEDNITVVLIDMVSDEAGAAPVAGSGEQRLASQVERETTQPDAVPPPPAVDTGVHRITDARAPERNVTTAPATTKRSWLRPLAMTLLLLLILAGAGFAASRYALSNSYFVGADGAGTVTIYRGIPEEVAGLTLKKMEEQSSVTVDQLPDFLRGDVQDGIKAESLQDARTKVANLEERARDADFDKGSDRGDGT